MEQTALLPTKLNIQLGPEAKVLIVGGRGANFGDDWRSHPRLIFWDSLDPQTQNKTRIPEDVSLILITRFVSHSLFRRLKAIVPAGVRFISYPQGTGAIKEILRLLVGNQGGESMDSRKGRKPGRGELAKFVRDKADFDAEDRPEQIRHLHTAAALDGIDTSEASVRICYYRLRREWLKSAPVSKTRPTVEVEVEFEQPGKKAPVTGLVVTPKEAVLPVSRQPAVPLEEGILGTGEPQEETTHQSQLAESGDHLRGFIAKLRAIADEAELAAVAFEEVIADRERLLKTEKELRELKERLKSIISPNGLPKS